MGIEHVLIAFLIFFISCLRLQYSSFDRYFIIPDFAGIAEAVKFILYLLAAGIFFILAIWGIAMIAEILVHPIDKTGLPFAVAIIVITASILFSLYLEDRGLM